MSQYNDLPRIYVAFLKMHPILFSKIDIHRDIHITDIN